MLPRRPTCLYSAILFMYRGQFRWPNQGYVSILIIFFTLVYKVDLLNGCDSFSKWTLLVPVNWFRPLSLSLLFPTRITEAGVQCLSLLHLRHSAALICWIFAVDAAQICWLLLSHQNWFGTRYKFTFLSLESNKTFLIENLHMVIFCVTGCSFF